MHSLIRKTTGRPTNRGTGNISHKGEGTFSSVSFFRSAHGTFRALTRIT